MVAIFIAILLRYAYELLARSRPAAMVANMSAPRSVE
jgi:hypothetical protein